MIELTTAAKRCLDDYLGDMRASLDGCPSVDSSDVERDVMEHIEKSLAEAPTPVDSPALCEVLDQLGSPSQWIPEEELSWRRRLRLGTRRVLKRLWSGPEDFRLAYLSIGLLAVAGLLLRADPDSPVMMMMCVVVSFLFARAALAADSDHQRLGAQRWLLYPVLILVYFPLALALLLWTVGPVAALADLLEWEVDLGRWGRFPSWIVLSIYLGITSTVLWWFLLGLATWRWPGLVRNTFYPFANRFRGRHGLLFGAFGLLVLLGALAFGGWVLSGSGLH